MQRLITAAWAKPTTERGLRVRLFTLVRASTIRPTRPITDMQSDICVHPIRADSVQITLTSKGLTANGQSVQCSYLTGSLLRRLCENVVQR
jgi:hypothetical protein